MLGLLKWVLLASKVAAAIAAAMYVWHVVPNPTRVALRGSLDTVVAVVHGHTIGRPGTATVLDVIDGDTLSVRLASGGSTRVRLLMADAPEHSDVRASTGHHVDCGSAAALDYLSRLVGDGDHVTLTTDPTQHGTDKYGRRLAYVSHDGVDLGRSLIKAGWAKVYVYDRPGARIIAYQAAAATARTARAGVYATCGGDFHRIGS